MTAIRRKIIAASLVSLLAIPAGAWLYTPSAQPSRDASLRPPEPVSVFISVSTQDGLSIAQASVPLIPGVPSGFSGTSSHRGCPSDRAKSGLVGEAMVTVDAKGGHTLSIEATAIPSPPGLGSCPEPSGRAEFRDSVHMEAGSVARIWSEPRGGRRMALSVRLEQGLSAIAPATPGPASPEPK